MDGSVNVQFQPEAEYISVPLAINIQQLMLPKYGDHEMRLVIDNQEVAIAPLSVRQAPNQILPA